MKTYLKIDIYFQGDYLCSTNQSKTCKEAVSKYLNDLERNSHSIGGLTRLESYVLKHSQDLRAFFDKTNNKRVCHAG